ncbi:hypothetical protein Sjap_015963 [Stephania japonica]|uniref:Uncharacterized protein n=1 Tax=Stephania japonica TaxID=461633 RepID=A0AAP0ILQ9_9MAGN
MAESGGEAKALNKSCVFVIGNRMVAGVERFAFKGVASNLVTYLTEVVKLSNSAAAKTVNSWCGVNFLLPLLGAFLADSFLGRYSTILASSFIYVVGLVALTSTAIVSERNSTTKTSSSSLFPLLCSLFLISIAQGGYNPCLQAFGAEQLNNDEELPSSTKDGKGSNQKSLFFKWWYFGICSGSLLGISLMAYVQDSFGWSLGFAIPAIAMTLSAAPFSCGTRFYTVKETKGLKQIESFVKAIKASVPNIITRRITLSSSKNSTISELELEEKPLCSHEGVTCAEALVEMPDTATHVLSDVKAVSRLLPIWAMLLTFAVIFQQPATFFTKQGMTMKRNIGKNFMIPPASLQSVINLSIILLMPLYDKIVIPIIQFITRSNKGIDVMQRMGIGMLLSVIAMTIAALVERKRLVEIGRTAGELQSSPMCIFWLLPQYIILGMSDVFTVVGMQEFFYSEVPRRLRTIGMALHLSVFGVGSFLSAFLISLLDIVTASDGEGRHSWFSNDMREARLDKYYWILALSSALSLFFFICLCKQYKTKTDCKVLPTK